MPAARPRRAGELHVVVDREAADRDDERAPERDAAREGSRRTRRLPGFGEPDRVEQSRRRLGHPRRRVALARQRGDRLRHDRRDVEVRRRLRRRGPRADRACPTRSSPDARARPRRPGCSSAHGLHAASRRRPGPRGRGARADRPAGRHSRDTIRSRRPSGPRARPGTGRRPARPRRRRRGRARSGRPRAPRSRARAARSGGS